MSFLYAVFVILYGAKNLDALPLWRARRGLENDMKFK